MGYKRKELRVLSGSLNLLTPGDKIPATDAMQLENWRVDQSGALVSRNGVQLVTALSASDPEDQIHTMGRLGEGTFYIGYGTALIRYPNQIIATGLTGQPFGIASMNGFAWIMDQNVQGRDDGANFTTAVPQPPPTGLTATAGAADPNGLTGSYTYYYTYVTSIGETNPSPVDTGTQSGTQVAPSGQDVDLTGIGTSADPTVIGRNIYRIGGTLGQPYQVGTINDNATTTFTDTMSDVEAAAEGIALEFNHDPPPAAQGLVGPYFGRLMAFNSRANPNRMWWTMPGEPQYWPGAASEDSATGQWVDIGDSDEAILQITCHARHAIIYKQYSIWRLIGDPDSGTLEIANTRYGLFGPRAVANTGSVDYFGATSGGLRGIYSTSDGVTVTKLSQKVDPLFLVEATQLGPGSSSQPIDDSRLAQCAMESVGNLVILSYAEPFYSGPGNSCSLLYGIDTQNLSTMRIQASPGTPGGFTTINYIGDQVWAGNGATVVELLMAIGVQPGADPDLGTLPINLYYQSGFQDCGYPDNQKVWLDLVIDAETNGNDVTVEILTDNGTTETAIGTLNNTSRTKQTFPLSDIEATNLAVRLECESAGPGVRIHAIYLYYYVEARLASWIATIPFELAAGKVVQVKELQVDADTSQGAMSVALLNDLPGNQIADNDGAVSLAKSATRRMFQCPIALIEGRIFQFGATAQGGLFRLYGARALMRVVGTYIEAYEAAAGFVWDSMEQDFSSGITHIPRGYAISLYANPIKRAREIALQIETVGAVTVQLWTDLPGDAQAMRATFTVNTSAAQTTVFGRREVRLPLPAGLNAEIEGRFFRLLISGNSQFKLYEAAIEMLPVGVYLEAYEAAGGAVYDSREIDLGTPKVKEGREIEVDIETAGATLTVYTDLPSGVMTQVFTAVVATTGRQQILLALPIVEGRLYRLIISSANSFRLYGARVLLRAFGQYLTGGEGTSGAFYDSTELDLGTQQVKQLREVELDAWLYGQATVTVYTDLPGNAMAQRVQTTVGPTSGRTQIQIPLPQGAVPDNYIFGRLARVTISSSQSVKLFGARVDARSIGQYIEGYEAQAGACWDSTPIDLGSPAVKAFDEVRFECDTDGPVAVQVWTDLPGEAMAVRAVQGVANAAMARAWATVPLLPGVQGRSVRLIVAGANGFRLYKAQVRARAVGRYIAQPDAGGIDAFRTLEFDYGTERVKLFKKLELDLETDGAGTVTMAVSTNQSGAMAAVLTETFETGGNRQTLKVFLPLNTRGRLMRVDLVGAGAAILYRLRAWVRPVNEPRAGWEWAEYPVESSAELPEWSNLPLAETAPMFAWQDLPVEPTPPQWQWAPFPVAPTEPQWQWAKVLSVEGTSDKWDWVTLPGTTDPAVEAEAA